jgi:hypothetical protein
MVALLPHQIERLAAMPMGFALAPDLSDRHVIRAIFDLFPW